MMRTRKVRRLRFHEWAGASGKPEDGAIGVKPAPEGRPVEVSVRALYQPEGGKAVSLVKAAQSRLGAGAICNSRSWEEYI